MTIFDKVYRFVIDDRTPLFRKVVTFVLGSFFWVVLPWFIPMGLLGRRVFDFAQNREAVMLTAPLTLAAAGLLFYGLLIPTLSKRVRTMLKKRRWLAPVVAVGYLGYLATWAIFSGGDITSASIEAVAWLLITLTAPLGGILLLPQGDA